MKTDTILVVAAHPDDEVLFAGGTIARHSRRGDNVHIVFLADGESSRGAPNSTTDFSLQIAERQKRAGAAAGILGANAPRFFDFPDNQLDRVPLLDLNKAVESVIRDVDPATIYTHHHGDLNIDHRLTHQAVLTASRPVPGSSLVKIFAGETLSSTEWQGQTNPNFAPNVFIEITDTLELKLEALRQYGSEIHSFPHPRSIKSCQTLAEYRGSSCGALAAEAFELVRWVNRLG